MNDILCEEMLVRRGTICIVCVICFVVFSMLSAPLFDDGSTRLRRLIGWAICGFALCLMVGGQILLFVSGFSWSWDWPI